MKLIWHILKKDLTGSRAVMLLWVLLLGGEIFFDQRLLTPASADSVWYGHISLLSSLFSIGNLAVCYILVAGLVLEEPLVGTRMFWATRPIAGGRLLIAKLLGIVLMFGVLPVLVRLPWWLYCGYGWSGLGVAAVTSFLVLLILAVVPAVVLAAFTGQSSRFTLASLLLLLVIPVATVIVIQRNGARSFNISGFFIAIVVGCSMVAIGWQYCTRRLWSAVAILVVGLTLFGVCLLTFPRGMNWHWPEDKTQLDGTEAITAEIQSARMYPLNTASGSAFAKVNFKILVHGIPDDMKLLSGVAEVELRWPDGSRHFGQTNRSTPLESESGRDVRRALLLGPEKADPETATKVLELEKENPRISLKQAKPRLTNIAADEACFYVTMEVTREISARISTQVPVCLVSARFKVGRPEVLFETPLTVGATKTAEGVRLLILSLEEKLLKKPDLAEPTIRSQNVTIVCATKPDMSLYFFAVDRAHGMFHPIDINSSNGFHSPICTNIERKSFSLAPSRIWRTGKWVEIPDWFSHTTLAVVTYRTLGGFDRHLQGGQLEISPE